MSVNDLRLALSALITFAIVIAVICLSLRSNLLRDESEALRKPYSFARVQLVWWTTLISGCLAIKYGFMGTFDVLSQSCLILLGISIATSGAAKVIDNRDIAAADRPVSSAIGAGAPKRHQDEENTAGFLTDILSDDQGVSVQRLQSLIFNVLFGFFFVYDFAVDVYADKLPDFSTVQLGLLGLSAATYAAFKAQENK